MGIIVLCKGLGGTRMLFWGAGRIKPNQSLLVSRVIGACWEGEPEDGRRPN